MSDSVKDFSKKCTMVATTLPRAQREAVVSASLAAKDIFTGAAAVAGLKVGQRMRGVGKSGAAWGVGFKVAGDQTPTSLIAFRGPVHLVESDTKAHEIVTRRRGVTALRLPFGFRASVQSPGTHGKHFFKPAEEQVKAQTPVILKAATRGALLSAGFQ